MDDSDIHPDQSGPPIELRVLHGPQAGSTMPLEPGEHYTFGTADSCAVLLSGRQVEAEHATLYADSEGIHVVPHEGKVLTLDRGELAEGDVVELGTVLRLGRVLLTIDDVSAPWPQDDELDEPIAATPAAARPAERDADAAPAADAATIAAPAASAPSVPPKSRAPRSRTFVAPGAIIGTFAMLLMGAAVAAWVAGDARHSPAAETPGEQAPAAAAVSPAPAVLDVAELTRAFPEATLKAVREPDGKWVLSGRTATEETRKGLREAVAAMPFPVDVRVMLDAERMALATKFVEERRVPGQTELTVKQGNAGALRITGATANAASLAALTEAANKELANAAPVEMAVLLRHELVARFDESLRAAGLARRFKTIRTEPQLELEAVLSAADMRTWETLFLDFTREWGTVLTISAQIQQERDRIESQVEAVVAGPQPYIVTTGGKRITPGGVLDGRTLVAIRNGELFFSDGLRVRYAN